MVLAEEAAPGGAAVAVGTDADAEKIEELLRSERGGMRLTAVGMTARGDGRELRRAGRYGGEWSGRGAAQGRSH